MRKVLLQSCRFFSLRCAAACCKRKAILIRERKAAFEVACVANRRKGSEAGLVFPGCHRYMERSACACRARIDASTEPAGDSAGHPARCVVRHADRVQPTCRSASWLHGAQDALGCIRMSGVVEGGGPRHKAPPHGSSTQRPRRGRTQRSERARGGVTTDSDLLSPAMQG